MKKLLSILTVFGITTLAAQEQQTFSLEEAINYAIEHNYDVKSARLDVDIAKKQVQETTAIGLPQINGAVDYKNYIDLPVSLLPAEVVGGTPGEYAPLEFGTKHNVSAGIQLNQLLFDGSYIVGLRAAKFFVQMANDKLEHDETVVRNDISQAYFLVLVAEENTEVLERNDSVMRLTLNDTEEMYKAGFVEKTDVEQIELLLATIENSLNNSKRHLSLTREMLALRMGMEITTEYVLTENLHSMIENIDKEVMLLAFDVNKHIDYRLAIDMETQNELLLSNQKAAYMPSMSGFIAHQQNAYGNEFGDVVGDTWYPTSVWGVSLQVPIFSSTMRNSRVQKAEIELEKSQVVKEKVSQALKLGVDQARSDLRFTLDQYEIQKRSFDLAGRIGLSTLEKFKQGRATSLEVSQVQNQFFESQGRYVSSIFEVLSAKAALDKALNNYTK